MNSILAKRGIGLPGRGGQRHAALSVSLGAGLVLVHATFVAPAFPLRVEIMRGLYARLGLTARTSNTCAPRERPVPDRPPADSVGVRELSGPWWLADGGSHPVQQLEQ